MPSRKRNRAIEIRAEATLDFDSRKLRIDTKIDFSALGVDPLNRFPGEVTRKVLDLEEEIIKEALMALGWTPPVSEPSIGVLRGRTSATQYMHETQEVPPEDWGMTPVMFGHTPGTTYPIMDGYRTIPSYRPPVVNLDPGQIGVDTPPEPE